MPSKLHQQRKQLANRRSQPHIRHGPSNNAKTQCLECPICDVLNNAQKYFNKLTIHSLKLNNCLTLFINAYLITSAGFNNSMIFIPFKSKYDEKINNVR